jgi:G3E family GTPase
MSKARYIMIGGFLGAGKTTAVLKLAEHLSVAGSKVGLITNDQSVGLVDTAMLQSHGFAVEEITGGCFCCRFNSLVDAADKLSVDTRPDVFIAEPVGSCTDLKASVSYPLRRMYGDNFSIAPLSVLIDPIRALRILGVEAGKPFSPKVVYVYTKQLEEAEFIVINKIDLLNDDRRKLLRDALAAQFPKGRVFEVSARHGTGVEAWFNAIAGTDLGTAPSMDVDYELYAEGEALLGWLNCTVSVSSTKEPVDGNSLLYSIAQMIRDRLQLAGTEIAHLKMSLSPGDGVGDIAVVNVVGRDHRAEISHSLQSKIKSGELIVNLRAEGDPEGLKSAVTSILEGSWEQTPGLSLTLEHLEHFRPGKPQPTYRYAGAER